MNLVATAIKGTGDVLPKEAYKWQYIEDVVSSTAELFDFKEIRTPVFEKTELFQRSVGDTTDVVQKEMYTFYDKGGRSVTLRPEGTAGVVRSVLEHGLFNEALPVKAYYITSCYRYEKPQAGRLREFHQFGVECIGAPSPLADAEMIILGDAVFKRLCIKNISLEVNSIGCPVCRPNFLGALREFFAKNEENLCETCVSRLQKNPMRILDCKSPVCKEICEGAPVILDFLCGECDEHFSAVKGYLNDSRISFTVNPKIVRGLDYYTKTVFEFISNEIGAQSAVCAGGRYDGLSKELGGPKLPSLGFAMGLERVVMLLQKQNTPLPQGKTPDIYIAPLGEKAKSAALKFCNNLRLEGFSAVTDISERGLKAQMKYADKTGAKFSLVLGDSELENGSATLKNMDTGDTTEIDLNNFVKSFYNATLDCLLEGFESDFLPGTEKINNA